MNPKLVKAVYNQLGCESQAEFISTCEDIVNHGISSGFGSFVYTRDCIAFYRKYRKLINQLATEMAEDVEENGSILSLVAGFTCLQGNHTLEDIAIALFCPITDKRIDELYLIYNAMAWFAAEEVANHIIDQQYENK